MAKKEVVIGKILLARSLSLGVCESCTGGYILDRLTDVPGSSRYLKGGIVAYSNEVKIELLGISRDLIEDKGPVNEEVASSLARGIARTLKTDIGLGITGIAGPGGGSREHPVGEVFIALYIEGRDTLIRHLYLEGNRRKVKRLACEAALDILRDAL